MIYTYCLGERFAHVTVTMNGELVGYLRFKTEMFDLFRKYNPSIQYVQKR